MKTNVHSCGMLDDEPVNRIERLGPRSLSNHELLALLIGSSDQTLPTRILATYGSLIEIANASPFDLHRVEGMTRLRSARIRAALELGRRAIAAPPADRTMIRSPKDVADLLQHEMTGLPQEQLRLVLLNTRNHVLGVSVAYQGSLNTIVLRIGDLFRDAVRHNCAAIVVAHNHPSGDPTPSPEDITLTRDLVKAGKIIGIDLIDHIVIGEANRWVSLKERGLGFS